jgi:hypothetical protein
MAAVKNLGKIALLIFGLLPYITFILMFTIVGPGKPTTNIFFLILGILTMLSFPSLMVFYIINVYRSNSVMKEQKHLWAALIFCGNILVYPFYWYLHIWLEPKKTTEIENQHSNQNVTSPPLSPSPSKEEEF